MKLIKIIIPITKFEFTKILLIVISTLGVGIPQLSFAYPVVDSVDVKILPPAPPNLRAEYTIVWHNDLLLDNNSAIKAKVSSVRGFYGLMHRHKDANGINLIGSASAGNEVSFYDTTWLALGKKWTDDNGSSGGTLTLLHTGKFNGDECIGFVGYTRVDMAWSSISIPSLDFKCLGTPPANEWCALKTPEITLDYGTLMSDSAVGTRRSANVIVQCTNDIDYTLRLRGKNDILLTNGMNVTLTANNSPLVATILHGKAGDNSVVIEGTLNGTPVDGAFSGSEVLMVSYP